MATWTDPTTWATGDVPTAANFNAQLRDNPTFLYEAMSGQMFRNESYVFNFYALVTNQAHLTLLQVPRKITVSTVTFWISAVSGNIDVGIYNSSYTRLWSRGSVACPSGSTSISISAGSPTTLTLDPGIYWLAFAADNNTATFGGVSGALAGCLKTKTSSFALPSSISSPSASTSATMPTGYITS